MAANAKLFNPLLFIMVFYHRCLGLTADYSRQTQGDVVYDRVLLGHVVETFVTRGIFNCAHKCLFHPWCRSYNYQPLDEHRGFCELNDSEGNHGARFQIKPGSLFWQMKELKNPRNCLDLLRIGVRSSGIHYIRDGDDKERNLFCDLDSESGWAWTLVMSQSFQNRVLNELTGTPLSKDGRLNAENPNWDAYRLPSSQMEELKSSQSHWRITCNFPTQGLDYKNYVQASFTQFDVLSFMGENVCKTVEYMSVKGHNCSLCSVAWWQGNTKFLHHDLSYGNCEFESSARKVSIVNADYFGYYSHADNSFPCSRDNSSSTNHWFGGHV